MGRCRNSSEQGSVARRSRALPERWRVAPEDAKRPKARAATAWRAPIQDRGESASSSIPAASIAANVTPSKVPSRGTARFSRETVFGELGVFSYTWAIHLVGTDYYEGNQQQISHSFSWCRKQDSNL